MSGIRDVRNSDVLQSAPPSDWFPNLQGRPDVPPEVVEGFRRIREDMQRLYGQVQQKPESEQKPEPPKSVLTTFTELTIGSPTDPSAAVRIRVGRGDPETIMEGSSWRDIWLRTDAAGITTFMYVKTTEGKTGWVAAAL